MTMALRKIIANTEIYTNTSIDAMRACVRALIEQPHAIAWRHHGIGVLQGYVREECSVEVRIHVWWRRLLKEGMDASGDVHDHRFDMVSHVLHGCVQHEEWLPTRDNVNGQYEMCSLTHARAAAGTNWGGPTEPIDGRFSVTRCMMKIQEGQSYRFPALHFHRTPFVVDNNGNDDDEVVVSIIEKHRQRNARARLLYPIHTPPVMAFGHEIEMSLVEQAVKRAHTALSKQ